MGKEFGLHRRQYRIRDLIPYINWVYFYHAWGFQPKYAAVETFNHCYCCQLNWINSFPEEERPKAREAVKIYQDAMREIRLSDASFHTYGNVLLAACNSRGNDLLLYLSSGTITIPFLRQQNGKPPYLCLSDFIHPENQNEPDTIALFCTTVNTGMEKLYPDDDYRHLLVVTLADRLAEASAEKLHEEVRKSIWGYDPDEHLTPQEMNEEAFQGIRPAVGYPSLPDISLNRLILPLLDYKSLGMTLTENAMMIPHASVSGFMFSHPKSRYFSVGKISHEQFKDYANRRQMSPDEMRPFLIANL